MWTHITAIAWAYIASILCFFLYICTICISELTKRCAGELATNAYKLLQCYSLNIMLFPGWYWNYMMASCGFYISARSRISNNMNNPVAAQLLPHKRVDSLLSSWLPQDDLNAAEDWTDMNVDGAGHVLLRDINSMQQNQIPITTLCYYFHSLKLTSDKLWWEIFIAVLAKSESVLTKRTSDYVDLVELHFLPLLLNYLSSTPTITHTIRQNMFTIVGDAIKSHSAWLYNYDELWKCRSLGSIRFQWLHVASTTGLSDVVKNQAFSDIISSTNWNDVEPNHMGMFAVESHSEWVYNQTEFWKCSFFGSERFHWLLIASDMDTISDNLLNQAFSDIMSTTTWNNVEPTHITNSLMAMPFIITTVPYSVQYQITPPNGRIQINCKHIFNILNGIDVTGDTTPVEVWNVLRKLVENSHNKLKNWRTCTNSQQLDILIANLLDYYTNTVNVTERYYAVHDVLYRIHQHARTIPQLNDRVFISRLPITTVTYNPNIP